MNPLRIGLIGLGEAAHNIHLPACALLSDVKVVGGADPAPEARQLFAERAEGVPLYATPEEMLEAQTPDWVIVGSPPAYHKELCLLALRAGAHVLCEKPFVESASDGDAILAAEVETGKCVVVNHEFTRMPIFEACREQIGQPDFGELLFVQAWEHVEEPSHDDAGWRSQSLTMREFGTHVFDLLVSFHGAMPEQVYARMTSPGGAPGTDLVDVVTLDFPNSKLASVVLDRVCRGTHAYLDMRLDGEHASLRASVGGRAALEVGIQPRTRRPSLRLDLAAGGMAWREKGEQRQVLARNPGNAFAAATARVLEESIEYIDRGERAPTSSAHALDIVRLVEAAYTSATTGQPVRISSDSVSSTRVDSSTQA